MKIECLDGSLLCTFLFTVLITLPTHAQMGPGGGHGAGMGSGMMQGYGFAQYDGRFDGFGSMTFEEVSDTFGVQGSILRVRKTFLLSNWFLLIPA